MAGRTRTLAAAFALLTIVGAACSSNGDENTFLELDAPTTSSTTTTTTVSTTTTTEPTTTTLSEQELAEAEITQLVTDFWLTEFDTSTGEMGIEYLTGAFAERRAEVVERYNATGRILRDQGRKQIEATEISLDLAAGTGEVDICLGSASEVVDAVTEERIGNAADPEVLTTGTYFVRETPEGWRIYDFFWSAQDGNPEFCEIDQ